MGRYTLGILAAVIVVMIGVAVYLGRVGPETSKSKTAAYRRVISGQVLDVTGNSLVVEQNKGATIYTVATDQNTRILKKGRAATLSDIEPGLRVTAQGDFAVGYLKATVVRIQGGQAWNASYLANQVALKTSAHSPVNHIIFLIQENHSFDNYFGHYPGANGIPAGVRLPVKPGSPDQVAPFHLTWFLKHA